MSIQIDHAALFARAHLAGQDAADAKVPVPMQIVQRENPLDDNSPIVKVYAPVADGVCGFAWVNVRPGNSSFARYLKASHGAHKGYHGGINLWVRGYEQSYERKMAYASAFAGVLQEVGIKALAEGRLD